VYTRLTRVSHVPFNFHPARSRGAPVPEAAKRSAGLGLSIGGTVLFVGMCAIVFDAGDSTTPFVVVGVVQLVLSLVACGLGVVAWSKGDARPLAAIAVMITFGCGADLIVYRHASERAAEDRAWDAADAADDSAR